MQLGAIPIPQTDNVEYLKDNLAAANIKLTEKHIKEMEKLDKGEEGRIFNFRYNGPIMFVLLDKKNLMIIVLSKIMHYLPILI